MGLRDIMQGLGFWTDVFKWSEPSIVRVRLRGDWWLRLAIAMGAGGAGTCLLLVLFAINQRPPHPVFALIGGAIAFVIVAGFLFHGASSASGRVRVCQEGIQRKRQYVGFGAQMFEEANWPYDAIQQCVIVPGQAIGKSFSVMMIGGGGEWELVGVPPKIDLQQLAAFLSSRRIAVSSANFIPAEYTRPINLPVSLGLAGIGLFLLFGGLGFYVVRTFDPPGENVAQIQPAANFPQPEVVVPDQGPPPPPAAVNNQVAPVNQFNQRRQPLRRAIRPRKCRRFPIARRQTSRALAIRLSRPTSRRPRTQPLLTRRFRNDPLLPFRPQLCQA